MAKANLRRVTNAAKSSTSIPVDPMETYLAHVSAHESELQAKFNAIGDAKNEADAIGYEKAVAFAEANPIGWDVLAMLRPAVKGVQGPAELALRSAQNRIMPSTSPAYQAELAWLLKQAVNAAPAEAAEIARNSCGTVPARDTPKPSGDPAKDKAEDANLRNRALTRLKACIANKPIQVIDPSDTAGKRTIPDPHWVPTQDLSGRELVNRHIAAATGKTPANDLNRLGLDLGNIKSKVSQERAIMQMLPVLVPTIDASIPENVRGTHYMPACKRGKALVAEYIAAQLDGLSEADRKALVVDPTQLADHVATTLAAEYAVKFGDTLGEKAVPDHDALQRKVVSAIKSMVKHDYITEEDAEAAIKACAAHGVVAESAVKKSAPAQTNARTNAATAGKATVGSVTPPAKPSGGRQPTRPVQGAAAGTTPTGSRAPIKRGAAVPPAQLGELAEELNA